MAIGQDITISLGGQTVGKARTASYTEPSVIVDISGMDDTWDEKDAGSQNWAMSVEKLWTPAQADYAALRTAKAAGTAVAVSWVDASGRGRSGTAFISEMREGWSRDEPVISGIELIGHGAPTDDPDYPS